MQVSFVELMRRLIRLTLLCGFFLVSPLVVASSAELDNATCMGCHNEEHELPAADDEDEPLSLPAVDEDAYGKGVHGRMECIACHMEIRDAVTPHQINIAAPRADCVQCHLRLWETAVDEGTLQQQPQLKVVVENIDAYRRSFHARKQTDYPDRVNATCHECHSSHDFNVPVDKKGTEYADWRRQVPELCGTCHEDQIESYSESVHGVEMLVEHNTKSASCTDCHTNHEITNTSLTSFKLLNSEECGQCHMANLKTYRDTYHGQVGNLGGDHTAKCYDCHHSHNIQRVDHPDSKVHPDNRLDTCQDCHDGKKAVLATAGFVTFGPHANTHDIDKYPQMWIASKFMVSMLVGVFAFFWLHSGLWYYREWQDRKRGVLHAHVHTAALDLNDTRHVQRFAPGWRIAHLLFALTTMTLVLTGTSALFSHASWASLVAEALGGAKGLALIHRVAATLFIGIFLVHLVYVLQHLLRKKDFRWFGPDSLVPNWKDFRDVRDMFMWFLGKGDRPAFDRWAYYEKFDYWAVFWGVTVIGSSGMMLAFPSVTASYLPGWVFNVATLVHGEEAFMAAVFLFTVHFFNNHFRPDKLPPPDVVMFTGTQSLDEFRREHPAQYTRLVASKQLEHYLVAAPSRPMTLGSKILGLTLISFGLILLVLVATGFFTSL